MTNAAQAELSSPSVPAPEGLPGPRQPDCGAGHPSWQYEGLLKCKLTRNLLIARLCFAKSSQTLCGFAIPRLGTKNP